MILRATAVQANVHCNGCGKGKIINYWEMRKFFVVHLARNMETRATNTFSFAFKTTFIVNNFPKISIERLANVHRKNISRQ